MKKISSIFAVLAATAGLYISCTDLSQIEKDIESLDSRVTAFENQMKTVNDEIAALGKLEAATTISSVTPDGKRFLKANNSTLKENWHKTQTAE